MTPELETARELALRAGAILRARFRTALQVQTKGGRVRDLVTEADRASEELIVDGLKARFPEHTIYAEESGQHAGSSAAIWYVDPLDGTVNFARGHPFFAVSLGFARAGQLEVGVVFAPLLDELYCAARGAGAWRERPGTGGLREELRVSTRGTLLSAIIASGFAYRRNETRQDNRDNVYRLLSKIGGFRRCGSAAIDLAYVAAGHFDAHFELWLQPFDVAAGAVLVREAGGTVTDFAGPDFDVHGSNVIASNGLLHETLRAELDPFVPEETA